MTGITVHALREEPLLFFTTRHLSIQPLVANASGAAADGPEALSALLRSSAGGGPAGVLAASPARTASSARSTFWLPS